MKYVILCRTGFKDGNIFDRQIKPGEILEVDEMTWLRCQNSDPLGFDLIEARVEEHTFYGQCKATRKSDGKRCTVKALPGEDYCFSHIRFKEELDAEA